MDSDAHHPAIIELKTDVGAAQGRYLLKFIVKRCGSSIFALVLSS